MSQTRFEERPIVLVAGATGYVGRRLVAALEDEGTAVRCLARHPEKLWSKVGPQTEVVMGDVLDRASLDQALRGVTTAYYLVHLMSGSKDFESEDRRAADYFAAAARQAGVARIIYLGGLGDDADSSLSPHLRSRHEVGETLKNSGVETIEFRASAILGDGSLSYDMVKSLTERLPVMVCPRWLSTPTQPIAIGDVVSYLIKAKDLPKGGSRIYEIGGTDVVKYSDLIREYARQKGLKRLLIPVPFLSPRLSGLWLALVTPSKFEIGRHLIEGLRNPTVVRDQSALADFSIRPVGVKEAIRRAIADTGPDAEMDRVG